MIVTVVGSGTLVPSPRRSTPALAVEDGDFQITFDGGSGTLRRQAELGLDFRRTRTLCFTHIHPDHTLDVLQFLFATAYTPGYERTDPIHIVGPRGFSAYLDALRHGIASWTDGGKAGLTVTELNDGDTLRTGPFTLEAFELNHSVRDIGFRVTGERGGRLAVTGDTAWCDRLVDLARDVDVLVCECSTLANEPAPGHLSAREAGRLAATADVAQLVLTHLYPLADDRARIPEAAEAYSGPILLASDGTRLQV